MDDCRIFWSCWSEDGKSFWPSSCWISILAFLTQWQTMKRSQLDKSLSAETILWRRGKLFEILIRAMTEDISKALAFIKLFNVQFQLFLKNKKKDKIWKIQLHEKGTSGFRFSNQAFNRILCNLPPTPQNRCLPRLFYVFIQNIPVETLEHFLLQGLFTAAGIIIALVRANP